MKSKSLNWLRFVIIIPCIMIFIHCSEQTDQKEMEIVDLKIEKEDYTNEVVTDVSSNIQYKIPTPNELFELLDKTDIKFNASALNSLEKATDYINPKFLALNFGVYSTDLIFIAHHDIGKQALEYYKMIKELSESLNIGSAFDETVFKRVEESMSKQNKDSLLCLSNETYYNAYSYLEENGREKTLAYIILGGWIESLYILTDLGTYEEGGLLAEKIGDQQLILENLIGMLLSFNNDEEIQETVQKLAEIEELFLNLEQIEEEEKETTQEENGRFIFRGGIETIVSKEDFEKIKQNITNLRTQVIEARL